MRSQAMEFLRWACIALAPRESITRQGLGPSWLCKPTVLHSDRLYVDFCICEHQQKRTMPYLSQKHFQDRWTIESSLFFKGIAFASFCAISDGWSKAYSTIKGLVGAKQHRARCDFSCFCNLHSTQLYSTVLGRPMLLGNGWYMSQVFVKHFCFSWFPHLCLLSGLHPMSLA